MPSSHATFMFFFSTCGPHLHRDFAGLCRTHARAESGSKVSTRLYSAGTFCFSSAGGAAETQSTLYGALYGVLSVY